uniref:non-specific serine/threonine protein kinase n=1 Tax=Oryza barthii TaxID=65489 RepID=A0A0D3F2L4_9ORYZ
MANKRYASFFLFFMMPFSLLHKSYPQSVNQSSDEHQILLELKKHWGSSPVLSRWSSNSAAHCNWGGITCTNGVVTGISLPNQTFIKPIPPSICLLKNLTHLDVSYNNISSPFPTMLYNCSNLKYLDLSNNTFAGKLPNDINSLPALLEHLNLSSNHFTGRIPPSIGLFPRLKSLLLDTNQFDGKYPAEDISNLADLERLTLAVNPFVPAPFPTEFGRLTHLTYLWLSNMNITGEIPESLSSLRELNLLDLSSNKLQGKIPTWIWQHKKLQYLYMYGNKFTGEIESNITALNLVEIDVSANELTGTIPDGFGKMTNLTLLFLYFNKLSGSIPPSVGLLPKLTDIRLFNNMLSGSLPSELGKHSPLANLEVSNNNLSGELPEGLCFNRKLYSSVVFNNSFSGKVPSSLDGCHPLQNLMLYNNNFSGEFPRSLWSVVTDQLSVVVIQNNNFSGTFPAQLPWNFTHLDISNNRFSGPIPTLAGKMQVFIAANNFLSGEIPWDLTGISQVTKLDLSRNQISGSIPMTIGVLARLNTLNLSGNQISGNIPVAFGYMTGLTVLDLSSNELSGEIPEDFNKLMLNFLNLSMNQLTGEIPTSLQNKTYEQSFLFNPGIYVPASDSPQNFPIYRERANISKDQSGRSIALISAVASIMLLVSAMVGFMLLRRKKRIQDHLSWKLTPFHVLHFTASDILSGLCEQNWIGTWKWQVCSEAKLLIYEYMENGSLHQWLHQRERIGAPGPLDWPTRLQIAIDSARGLCYMHHHCSPPIVHRDVKCANILLDHNFRAKMADFGLAKILLRAGDDESFSAIAGTFGYMAPEYGHRLKVNEKIDVYSFGVVLLEIITGRVANDGGEYYCLAQWAWRQYQEYGLSVDLLDEGIRDPTHVEDALEVFTLAVICTGEHPSMRPSMKDVLHVLLRFDRKSNGGILQDDICDETALLES